MGASGSGNLLTKVFTDPTAINIGDVGRIAAAAGTGGASEIGYAAKRTAAGMNTPYQTIADQSRLEGERQRDASDRASRLALQAPKNITPDNFLSLKAKQLAALRLGMGGSGSAQAPDQSALGSTLLKAGDMTKLKTKLGQ